MGLMVNGAAKNQSTPMRELAKQVPTRLIRLFLRVASLQKGQYVLYLTVGDDEIQWRIGEMGRMEH